MKALIGSLTAIGLIASPALAATKTNTMTTKTPAAKVTTTTTTKVTPAKTKTAMHHKRTVRKHTVAAKKTVTKTNG